ncbi:hypothetical protein GCM10010201_00920 [Pilimelia columellifera subsp. columellifera]|uniref:Metallophosphoesterase n=1 Tax=Pilimelia columellifera subsp. columellifera TaxID=706583 RepID=A0ABN3MW64_9ACTN
MGFTPRGPVPWLAPLLLLSTGLRSLLATLFGAYLDKRELQNSLPSDIHHQPGDGGELWLDYVADLGDGFDATYSVAYLLAQPELVVDGQRLPRGHALVLGGDQVYPTASMDDYEDRFKGPYRSALPVPPPSGPRPTMYALPGNHDWYDGLTAFLRVFVRMRTGSVGGWRTEQSRSYFAVRLPGDWWLYAIDEQFGSYLDDPQLRYFEQAGGQLRSHHRVILATPSPSWVKASDRPDAYDTLDYFLRTVIAPTGASVRLILAGDLHHYARYHGPDRELITCGGGGAYLAGTHQLPSTVTVPSPDAIRPDHSPPRTFTLAGAFPTAQRSRRYAWGVVARLPWRNPGFLTMLGILHTLWMLSIAELVVGPGDGEEQRLFSIPAGIMLTMMTLATVLFAKPPSTGARRTARHVTLGLAHGVAHLALGLGGALLWTRLPVIDWVWPLPPLTAAAVYGPALGVLGGVLVAVYLLVASLFRVNLNELFAGQGIEDAKSFLRLRITDDGTLTIYPLAVDNVCHQWRPRPDDPADAPWLAPATPLTVRLAEPPIVLTPGGPAPGEPAGTAAQAGVSAPAGRDS